MEKENDKLNDMSETFIAEVGQKSAIASNFDETSPIEKVDNNEPVTSSNKLDNTTDLSTPPVEKPPKKKKSHPFLIILLMIFCLTLGAFASYYYFEIFNSKSSDPKKTVTKEAKEKDEELNPDGYFVNDLINRYDFYEASNIEIYTNLYSKEKLDIESFPIEDAKYLAAREALNMNKIKGNLTFTSDEFHQAMKKLFGTKLSVGDGDILKSANSDIVMFSFDSTNNVYQYKDVDTTSSDTSYTMERKILKSVKTDTKLTITVAVAILDTEKGQVYKELTVKDTGELEASSPIEGINAEVFDISQNYETLNQYQYTFDYDSENDNYILNRIELVK